MKLPLMPLSSDTYDMHLYFNAHIRLTTSATYKRKTTI